MTYLMEGYGEYAVVNPLWENRKKKKKVKI